MDIAIIIVAVVGPLLAYLLGLQRSRHERLEEKRAEVLAELSRLFFEVDEKYFQWARRTQAQAIEEKGRAGAESLRALVNYFHSNVTWLDYRTAVRAEDFIEELREMGLSYYDDLSKNNFQLTEESRETARRMHIRTRTMREELIREFRKILDPYDWWKRVFPWRIRMNPSQGSPPPQD